MDILWTPQGGHGALWAPGAQCEILWLHGIGMGLCGLS